MPKVALIGAGSAVFAQRMITDILAIDGLDTGMFALVDLDTERLELAHEVAEDDCICRKTMDGAGDNRETERPARLRLRDQHDRGQWVGKCPL